MARRMGGQIDVRIEGCDAVVLSLTLPQAASNAIRPEAEAPVPPPAHRARILVVEDEPEFRDMVVRTLRRLGYDVAEASGGQAALDIASGRETDFDLLLTDVYMPDLHGPALVRQLMDRHPALRTLYMSGFTDREALQREVGDSGLEFLQKPFRAADLSRRVGALLQAS